MFYTTFLQELLQLAAIWRSRLLQPGVQEQRGTPPSHRLLQRGYNSSRALGSACAAHPPFCSSMTAEHGWPTSVLVTISPTYQLSPGQFIYSWAFTGKDSTPQITTIENQTIWHQQGKEIKRVVFCQQQRRSAWRYQLPTCTRPLYLILIPRISISFNK